MELVTPECFLGLPPDERLQQLYAQLDLISGGSASDDQTYTSHPAIVTTDGSIPAGARGWSLTAISGTVTLEGSTIPVGVTLSGGGYGNTRLATALTYTISSGSAALQYDS